SMLVPTTVANATRAWVCFCAAMTSVSCRACACHPDTFAVSWITCSREPYHIRSVVKPIEMRCEFDVDSWCSRPSGQDHCRPCGLSGPGGPAREAARTAVLLPQGRQLRGRDGGDDRTAGGDLAAGLRGRDRRRHWRHRPPRHRGRGLVPCGRGDRLERLRPLRYEGRGQGLECALEEPGRLHSAGSR